MGSLMKENESERVRGRGRAGLRECRQISWNSVSDWFKWELLSVREGWEAALSEPVGDALRMCFPPLLFILSLIYLYISVGPAIGRAASTRASVCFLFSFSSSRGFPTCALWLAAINQNKLCSYPTLAPRRATRHCFQIRQTSHWLHIVLSKHYD